MDEWRRLQAVRRLLWVAIGLSIFPGSVFVTLFTLVKGPSLEALVALLPAGVMGWLAWRLNAFEPERPPAQIRWRPERELITPLPRPVEPRWETPRATLPVLLALFPTLYLAVCVLEGRAVAWEALGLVSAPAVLAFAWSLLRLRSWERRIVQSGVITQGLVRRIVAGRGFFRMKVTYRWKDQEYFVWSPNLSPTSWFGPLMVEERRFVTLLVDPDRPERFVVYPFCGLQVPADPRER